MRTTRTDRLVTTLLLAALAAQAAASVPGLPDALPDELLEAARRGYPPDSLSMPADSLVEELLLRGGLAARYAAWCSRLMGDPLPGAPTPALLEHGEPPTLPAPQTATADPSLMRAALLGAIHRFGGEGEYPLGAELVGLVTASWNGLPQGVRTLALQALGRLGLDVTGDLPPEELRRAGTGPALRYMVEIGALCDPALPPGAAVTERVYAAGCAPPESLGPFLSDAAWAVRHTAAARAPLALLEPLLRDSVPYVRLAAAGRLADSTGETQARLALAELALEPGPVGHMAAGMLGAGDSMLIALLLEDPAPARRAAAQSAWLSCSLAVDSALRADWLADPYWVLPVEAAWHQLDSGDSTGCIESCALILDLAAAGAYDHPRRASEYAVMLEARARGDSAPEPPESPRQPLPFEPQPQAPDTAVIRTTEGDVTMLLLDDVAPVTCAGFRHLAAAGFYDGLRFHRVIPGFVAQAGCPEGNGYGGPGYELPNERSLVPYGRGVVGMADAGLDTGGSQFFIMLDSHRRLDGRYTAFGSVTAGEDVLDRITVGTLIRAVELR